MNTTETMKPRNAAATGAAGTIPVLYHSNGRHAAAAAVCASLSMIRSRHALIEEKCRRAKDDNQSREARIFHNVMYGHIVRKEFALHVLREYVLPRVKANPSLYRHTVKQLTRTVHREAVRWDSEIARTIVTYEGEDTLDRYDCLTEHVTHGRLSDLVQPFYYSIMQVLTRHGCSDSATLAAAEVANFLMDFAERRLTVEIAAYEGQSPLVRCLERFACPRLHHSLSQLRDLLDTKLMPRGYEYFDLNQDKNASQACNNLMQYLVDIRGINAAVDQQWVNETAERFGLK